MQNLIELMISGIIKRRKCIKQKFLKNICYLIVEYLIIKGIQHMLYHLISTGPQTKACGPIICNTHYTARETPGTKPNNRLKRNERGNIHQLTWA